MPNGEHVINPSAPRTFLRRVSWGGVFAGVVAVLLIQLVLLLLGAAVGLAVAGSRDAGGQTMQGVGIGAGLWWIISSIIAGFFGAMVASRLSSVPNKADGTLNGLVSWGTAQLVGMALAATAFGTLISGASNVLAGAMQGGRAGGFGAYAYVQPEAAPATQPATQPAAQAAREARETISGARPERAAQAAKTGAGVALYALIMLVLSGIAAAIGGSLGTPRSYLAAPPPRETDVDIRP